MITDQDRRFIVPFLDEELYAATEVVEDLLLVLAELADDPQLPAALRRPAAEAIGNLRLRLYRADYGSVYAPDGRYEHEPMAVITAPAWEVDAIGAAVAELARIRAGSAPELVDDVAEAFTQNWQHRTTVTKIVEIAARFHGVCDLAWESDQQAVLADVITEAAAGETRVILTAEQERAFRQLRDRLVAMWHDYSALSRWQY